MCSVQATSSRPRYANPRTSPSPVTLTRIDSILTTASALAGLTVLVYRLGVDVGGGGVRAHYYSSNGVLDRTGLTAPARIDSTGRVGRAMAVLRGGLLVAAGLTRELRPNESHAPIVISNDSGVVVATIGRMTRVRSAVRFSNGRMVVFGAGSLADSLEDYPLTVVAPDGDWVAVVERAAATSSDQSHYRVTRYSSTAAREWDRTFTYRPRRLSRALSEGFVDDFATRNADQWGGYAAARRTLIEAMPPIEFYPPIIAAEPGIDGSLWLLERGVTGDTAVWKVLDPNGRPTRSVRLPRGFRLKLGGADHVWGVELDEDGVSYIVRYRLEMRDGADDAERRR